MVIGASCRLAPAKLPTIRAWPSAEPISYEEKRALNQFAEMRPLLVGTGLSPMGSFHTLLSYALIGISDFENQPDSKYQDQESL